MQTHSSGLVLHLRSDNLPLKKRKHEIKRKYEKKPTKLGLSRGRWKRWERIKFLEGLRIHGKGKWKQIARMIPTRSTIQVKTHAQIVLKQMGAGKDVFELLHEEPILLQEEEQEKEQDKQQDKQQEKAKVVNTITTDYFNNENVVNDYRFDSVDDSVSCSQSTTMIEFSDEEQYLMSPRRIMVVIQEKTPPSELSSVITIPSSTPRPLKSHNTYDHHQLRSEIETEMSSVLTSSPIEYNMSMDTVFNAARILVELSSSPTSK